MTTAREQDIGILFVHGIGEQRRGEALASWGSVVAQCLGEVIEEGSYELLVDSATLVAADGDACPAHALFTISQREPEFRVGPPRTESVKVALAEAHWAQAFPSITYTEMLEWTLRALPIAIVSHFDRMVRRAGYRSDLSYSWGSWLLALWGEIRAAWALLLGFAVTPILYGLSLLVVLLALLPLERVKKAAQTVQKAMAAYLGDSYVFLRNPIASAAICSRVEQDLRWLDRRCRRVVIVAHSQGAAIAHEVLRRSPTAPCDGLLTFGSGLRKLADLETQPGHTRDRSLAQATVCAFLADVSIVLAAVIAVLSLPSQDPAYFLRGAAQLFVALIFAAILIRRTSGRLARIFEASSRQPLASPWLPPMAAIASYFVLGVVIDHGELRTLSSEAEHWLRAAMGSFVLWSGWAWCELARFRDEYGRRVAGTEQQAFDSREFASRFRLPNQWVKWLDIFSSHDPVPGGALLDSEVGELAQQRVFNLGSSLFDHGAYWANSDTFVLRLVDWVARFLPPSKRGFWQPLAPCTLQRIDMQREFRVVWRRAVFALAAVAAFGAAIAWSTQWPEPIVAGLVALGRLSIPALSKLMQTGCPSEGWCQLGLSLQGLVSFSAGLLIWVTISLLLWRQWNKRAMQHATKVASLQPSAASPGSLAVVWGLVGTWSVLPWCGLAIMAAWSGRADLGQWQVTVALGVVCALAFWRLYKSWALITCYLRVCFGGDLRNSSDAIRALQAAQLAAFSSAWPWSARGYELRARLLYALGDGDRARETITALDRLEPNRAYWALAQLHWQNRNWALAGAAFSKLPKSMVAFELGFVLERQGKPHEAFDAYMQTERDGRALYRAALLTRSLGEDASAFVEALSRALRAGHAEAAIEYAKAAQARGDVEAARQCYEHAARAGIGRAALLLGELLLCYPDPNEVDGGQERARQWIRAALRMGCPAAGLMLAQIVTDTAQAKNALYSTLDTAYLRIEQLCGLLDEQQVARERSELIQITRAAVGALWQMYRSEARPAKAHHVASEARENLERLRQSAEDIATTSNLPHIRFSADDRSHIEQVMPSMEEQAAPRPPITELTWTRAPESG